MATLLSLPAEILFDILERLQLRDVVSVCNSCRFLRKTIGFEKFFWLVDDFEGVSPSREEALQSAGNLVLSHALFYHVKLSSHKWDRDAAEELVRHGASLSRIPCGEYLLEAFLDEGQGESEQFQFMLANGASFDDVPGGINELLESVFREIGVGAEVDLLLKHGASFHKIQDIDQLFADTYYEGPSEELDLLEGFGLKMRTMPSEMYSVYQDFWIEDGDSSSLADQGRGSVERAVEILSRLERDTPEALPKELAHVCEKYSIISARMIIEEEPNWTLRTIPGGVDRLLKERYAHLATKEIVFLLQQGASLRSTPLDRDELLVDALRDLGPGTSVDFLLDQGASFDNAEGGVNRLLEVLYVTGEYGEAVLYLMEQHGAKLELVPSGMEMLLENTVVATGFESTAVARLIDRYGVSLEGVPCGLARLIVRTIRRHKTTRMPVELRDCVMLLKDDQHALDLILETAFEIGGAKGALTGFLLELGASLKRVPSGVPLLLQTIFRHKGHCEDIDYLLEKTDATMLEVPCGINTLLQEEILNGDRNPTTASFTNAEFLLNHGAALDQVPKGSHQVLREILDRFGKGSRSQWLERHGAVLKPGEGA